MVLHWHSPGGTWTPCEFPPALVHGIALISPPSPSMCVFGQAGRLLLQIGANQYALTETSPRITCRRGWILLGLRRRFMVRASSGALLYNHSYWRGQGRDFYSWLAQHAGNPQWRMVCGRQWSQGVEPSTLSRQ